MNMILPAAALAAIVAGGGWWFTKSQPAPGMTELNQITQAASDGAGEVDMSQVVEMTMGAVDAPVEVVEYASYTCPHCASFHQSVFKQIKENYIDTGKVRFTYREVYFDKYGMWASLIARCDESKFFGITDLIYKGQADWARAGSDAAIADELRKIGLLAGLGADQLDQCLSDGDKLRALVTWYQENATKDGIRSTPSFVIDGQIVSNMSYADFSAELDKRLNQ
jgi:protein-disulfide isomerase